MIDYTKIINECCKEGAAIFADQINGMHEGAYSYCILYLHRQAKKYSPLEFITEGEFYAMCLINIRSCKSEISESDNKCDIHLREDIFPIMEKSLTELINQKDLKTDQQKEKGDKIEAGESDFGKFKFEESALTILHGLFNEDAKLWERIDIKEFYNNFKELPAGTLKIKNVEGFCFLMSYIESHRIDIPNIDEWFRSHFAEISNYSKQKKEKDATQRQTQNKIIQDYIKNKLNGDKF